MFLSDIISRREGWIFVCVWGGKGGGREREWEKMEERRRSDRLMNFHSLTGSKKDGVGNIAKQAAGPFVCGECGVGGGGKGGKKVVASSTQPRALKQGELIW